MAGVYGMNFANMPDLHPWWAYRSLLGVMVIIALLMLYLFHRMARVTI